MARQKVKVTKSKSTMKHLVRRGWTLQAVTGKRMFNGQTFGCEKYILVKEKA